MKSKFEIRFSIVGMLLPIAFLACGQIHTSQTSEAPDVHNNSMIIGVPVQKLSDLSTSAQISHEAWSGDYWATARGGIARRWQRPESAGGWRSHIYRLPTTRELQSMSQGNLDTLSPAEKYDLYTRQLDFKTTNLEFGHMNRMADATDNIPYWYGICHGWAPASLLEEAPGALASVSGPYGKTINFNSADLKALTSKLYANGGVTSYFIGGRCDDQSVATDASGRPIKAECRDTNPATFHLVLADYLGKKDLGFVIDIQAGAEVWNQPVVGFDSALGNYRPLSRAANYTHAAAGTVTLVDVNTKVTYVTEENPSPLPTQARLDTADYSYTLELDAQGKVIGGEWISQDRPDFLWQLKTKPTGSIASSLTYDAIKKLLDLSHN